MNQEFIDYVERELALLYERGRDFAEEYPGLGERLGGLLRDRIDPGIQGLLEGAAFLAARVQLKLKSEFSEFTSAMLDQLLPTYLSPIPSSLLVQAVPKYEDANLREGLSFAAGSYIDATYVERERRVACRYRLGRELTVWPLHIERAEYLTGQAALQTLGLEVKNGTLAGLRLQLQHRMAAPGRDTEGVRPPGGPLNSLKIDELPIQLLGSSDDVNAMYEQLFAHCHRITLRYEDSRGDPMFVPIEVSQLRQVGFDDTDQLMPRDERFFAGYEILRDYFVFPQNFAAFKLVGLRRALSKIDSQTVDILFEFDATFSHLTSIVNSRMFGLYVAPATNLFEMDCSRIPISPGEYEHLVVADRGRWLDYEVNRVLNVHAHYAGQRERVPVFPLYSMPTTNISLDDALYFTSRRLPRLRTERERRFGSQSNYQGTETFVSLYEPAGLDDPDRVKELSVRALVSNRHLTEHLPVGNAGADFTLVDDTTVSLNCIVGPTKPRDSIIHMDRKRRDAEKPGPLMWRLVNLLSLNHLGLVDRSPEDRAAGIHELLAMFADISDDFTESQVRGVVSVSTRPVVRRLRQANGFNAARGLEVTVTFDEKAYEGSGVMLLGAALDRFFAEYTAINSFTQTIIASTQRGVVMRWPPRSGMGGVL